MTSAPPDALLAFAALARAGHYRDALLRLEAAWLSDRTEFYAGLLQVMVVCNQVQAGMSPERTLRRAIERLTPYAPTEQGLDVATLLDFLRAAEQTLAVGGTVPLPPPLHLSGMDDEDGERLGQARGDP